MTSDHTTKPSPATGLAPLDLERDASGAATTGAACDVDCGCGRPDGATRTLELLPLAGPRVACTLDGPELEGRLAEWHALVSGSIAREAHGGGIRLTFARGVDLRSIADLVAREQSCCSFLSFTIAVTLASTTLDVSGPLESLPVIDELLSVPA